MNIPTRLNQSQGEDLEDISDRTVVLFGDSHSYAVQRAIERRVAKGRPVPVRVHRLLKTHWKSGEKIGDTSFEQFLNIIHPLGPRDLVLSMVGGNQHAVFSTIQHPVKFDFLQPGNDSIAESGSHIIPYRMIARHFAAGLQRGDVKSLAAIREATKARVLHFIAPPPKGDNAFIQQYHESLFAKEGIEVQGVSTASLRMKFWKMQARLIQELCAPLDIEAVMPPPKAVDTAGFLRSEFYSKDATHANASYGELVLCQIERLAGSNPAKAGTS